MPDFRKPNLEADGGSIGREPYISVRSEGTSLGISRALRERLSVEEGDYVHLALDRTGRPWVGFLDEKTTQGEPQVRRDGRAGQVVNSTLMSRHLRSLLDADELESSVRFYLAGETTEDPETGAILHRLEVPEVSS
jgi:hypothetical protein